MKANWTNVEKRFVGEFIEVDRATLPMNDKWIVADMEHGYYQIGNVLLGELFLTPTGDSINVQYLKRWYYLPL